MANLSNINNKFLVTTGGNVGIGVTSPGAKLNIAGDVLINSGEYISWGTVGATSIEGSTASNKIQFRTGSADRMIINNTGVGIGTTSPDALLELEKSASGAVGPTLLLNNSAGGNTDKGNIIFASFGNTYQRAKIEFKVSSETNNPGNIDFYTGRSDLGTLTQKMTILGSGNVGIGTTNPATKLEVNGGLIKVVDSGDTAFYGGDYVRVFGTQSYGFRNSAGSAIAQISLTGNSYFNGGNVGIGTVSPTSPAAVAKFLEIQGSTAGIVLHDDGNDPYEIWASGGNLVFRYNNTQGENGMLLSSTGNLGIGSTSPTARLDILTNSATGDNNIDRHVRFRADNGEQRFNFFVGRSGNSANLSIYNSSEVIGAFISSDNDSYFNGGNVGIGTTSPSRELDIQASSGWAELALRGNTGASGSLEFWTNTTKRAEIFSDTEDIVFRNTSTNQERMRIASDGEIRVAGQTIVKGSNSKYNMTFPDNGGIAIGSAYTFGNIYGSSGNLYLRANSYPANTGSDATINFQTGNSSGGQADDVVIKGGSVGIGTTSPVAKLDIVEVSGNSAFNQSNNGSKIGRIQYGWYTGKSFTNNTAFTHIKTNLWMGGSSQGNIQYIMGGFTAKSYSYSASGYGEGSCMFHNWNGGFANLNVTNRGNWATFMQSPYTSTDGYCVIVLRHNYFSTPNIDFHQSYTGYPWRQVSVTAQGQSSSNTGLY